MNKRIISLLLVLFLVGLSCKKGDELTQFGLDIQETFVVPSSVGIDLPFNVMSPAVETNSQSSFEVNDTRKELVEQIILT